MSGIAGVIRLGGSVDPSELVDMLAPMSRRGPDRSSWLVDGNAGFGQALLATTPEALADRQPWRHPESGCIVVSDSRLDNRPELAIELGLTDRAIDNIGDGELLHAAWQAWGSDCANRLLGDFAFALWDPRSQRLFCARDIMGVRPFYFHRALGRMFAFASDSHALLALSDVPHRINDGRVADALVGELEGIDRTSTFYLDIERLPPARTMIVEADAALQEEYWRPLDTPPAQLPATDQAWIEAVRASLDRAVQRRLRGLGVTGAMISGGLDSSAVAALAQRKLETRGERLATFSAIDSANHCNETSAIRDMLNAFPFDATTLDVQQSLSVEPAIHQHLEEMREPFDGSATLISAIYAAAATRNVRWVMDGIPADNLYTVGGYFRQLARKAKLWTLWREARALHVTEGALYPTMRALQTLLGSLVPLALRRPWEVLRDEAMYRKLRQDSRISNEFADRVQLRKRFCIYRRDMRETRIGKAAGVPHTIMTAAYITAGIERYNRIASFHGVEPRHPFLDKDLIELHMWLPLSLRLHDGHHKWVLRAAMQDLLPHAVAWRRGKEHLGYLFNKRFWRSWVAYSTPSTALKTIINLNGVAPAEPPSDSLLTTAWLERRTRQMQE